MGTIKRNTINDNFVQCLIIAAESGDILFLDPQSVTILSQVRMRDTINCIMK